MHKTTLLLLRIIIAFVLVQTLRYKFTAHPDSVYIFTKIGLEPYGRIGIGVLELIAAILILIPKTIWAGALLSAGLMAGAIFSHLTKIGIEINGDHGQLFFMAVVIFIMSVIVLYFQKQHIPILNKRINRY